MTLAVVFDTETSGLPLFKEPSEHPAQPHIVQLGACLVDLDTHETISSLDVIVKPEGWTIPDEVAKIHGITTERAMDLGVPESLAVEMLLELCKGRLRIACMRHFEAAVADEWKDGSAECTAVLSTPILKIPPTPKMVAAGFKKHKTPNLGEAYRHFTGQELVNAHSAMADVIGCRDVYFAIKRLREQAEIEAGMRESLAAAGVE